MISNTWAEQDLELHERQAEEWLMSRPECDWCQEPIQEEYYFETEDGECLCEDCFRQYARDNFMKLIPEKE